MARRHIVLDNKVMRTDDTEIASYVPGAVLGRGVFETLRVDRGYVYALDEHIARFFKGLRTLKITPPFTKKILCAHLREVVGRNPCAHGRLRFMVFSDKRRMHSIITMAPYTPFAQSFYRRGCAVIVVSSGKTNVFRVPRVKSVDYRFFLDAFKKAQQAGAAEALIVNDHGAVIEGSRSNIFFVRDKKIYTPSLSYGCLNGITRRIIMQCARTMRIPCAQARVTMHDLFSADEVFLTNSVFEILPVASIQKKRLIKSTAGPVTQGLIKSYHHYTRRHKTSLR